MNLKTFVFSLLSLFIGLALTFLLLEVTFRFLPTSDSLKALPVNDTNPILRFEANRDLTLSRGPKFEIVAQKRVNNYGFLNDQDYDPQATSPLLAVIGDSFVEAVQVENAKTVHGLLAQEVGNQGRVYSFAASGSPLSNYLVYAQYAVQTFRADALVFVIVHNDFDQSLTKYKNAPGLHYFDHRSEQWPLVRKDYQPPVVRDLLRQSALVRYLALNLKLNWRTIENLWMSHTNSARQNKAIRSKASIEQERIVDSERVVDRFFEELPRQTPLPPQQILLVVDGIRSLIYDTNLPKADEFYYIQRMFHYFIKTAQQHGYGVIDLHPVFQQRHKTEGLRFDFPNDIHWNEHGHRVAAEAIQKSAVYQTLFHP